MKKRQMSAKFIFFVVIGAVLPLLLCSCEKAAAGSGEASSVISESSAIEADLPADEWTIMLYMCGSDLESKSGEATKNLGELMSAGAFDGVNIIIKTGGAKKWHTSFISPQSTDIYKLSGGELTLLSRSAAAENFGEAKTLSDLIAYSQKEFPAKRYGLILWDHGGGALGGVCLDENFSYDALTLSELKEALAGAGMTKKLDIIGFDACLMANIETACAVADYAENMIASEEKEPNGGWDYTRLVKDLGSEDFCGEIINSFAEKYKNKKLFTISHIDLSKFSPIREDFGRLARRMSEETPRYLLSALGGAMELGGDCLYDAGNVFSSYGIKFDEKNAVRYKCGEARRQGTGLSFWFSVSGNGFSEYEKISPDGEYSRFLADFYKYRENEFVSFISTAEEKDGFLAFSLSAGSESYVGRVGYLLLQYDGEAENKLYVLGCDNDCEFDGRKGLVRFGGNWVRFGENALYCSIKDENDGVTIYSAPVIVNDERAELMFSYDEKTYETELLGVVSGSGRICELSVGDRVCVIRRVIDDGFECVDKICPEFTFTGGEKPEVYALPDGIYQYTAYVKDVYGKLYKGGTATVDIKNGKTSLSLVTPDEVALPEELFD